MVVGLNVLYVCILLKVLVNITKNIRIIDLQRRVCFCFFVFIVV